MIFWELFTPLRQGATFSLQTTFHNDFKNLELAFKANSKALSFVSTFKILFSFTWTIFYFWN